MTLTAATLRHVVTVVALRTGRHPVEVLAVLATNHPGLKSAIDAEFDACLTGKAYRSFR